MVSLHRNPVAKDYIFNKPMEMGVSNSDSTTSSAAAADDDGLLGSDDPGHMRIRKPYTITKSRETWTDQEHDKFIEALHLYLPFHSLSFFLCSFIYICLKLMVKF